MMKLQFSLMLIFVCLMHGGWFTQAVIVTTPLGKLQGSTIQINGTIVYQFLGIPYAKPPLQELMLEKPIPYGPWKGVLDASTFGSSCAQQRFLSGHHLHSGSLDCLFLNIYVPRSFSDLKAVMLFIHGGSYMFGQGKHYNGTILSSLGGVIVVTINYRLDAYGFLSTMDDAIPGNFGLWDQRLAILWVRDNILSFAGDKDKITIFGESAGSYSTGMHMLSQHNDGLFQRVISESGVAVSPIGLSYEPIAYARRVSDYLGCTKLNASGHWDTLAFKICFRSKDSSHVLAASEKAGDYGFLAYRRILGPVVDGNFLNDLPEKVMYSNDVLFKKIDLMVGTNSAEGSLSIGPLQKYEKTYNFSLSKGVPRNVFRNHIAFALARDYYKGSMEVLEEIMKFYSYEGISDFDQAVKMIDLYGDFILQASTVKTVEYHSSLSNTQNTFQYYFTHQPSTKRHLQWLKGANHADELAFVFGPTPGTHMNTKEIQFSTQMIRYWSNFAKYGNPNGANESGWPKYNNITREYMDLNLIQTAKRDLLHARVHFWLKLSNEQNQTVDRKIIG